MGPDCGNAGILEIKDIQPLEPSTDGWVLSQFGCNAYGLFSVREFQVGAPSSAARVFKYPCGLHMGAPL